MSGRGLRIIICVGVLIIALWQPGDARGDTQQKPRVERDHPIQIVSDRLDAYHEKRMVVFIGRAVATQGERTIRSATPARTDRFPRASSICCWRSTAITFPFGPVSRARPRVKYPIPQPISTTVMPVFT